MIVRFGSTSASAFVEQRLERAGRRVGDEHHAADEVRLQLDALHQLVRVVDVLRERHVEHRPRRPVQPQAGELRVAHDADDAERADVLRQVEAEVLIERILVALEEALHERLVDDRDRRGRLVVGGRERAAAHHRDAEVLQVVAR